MTLENRSDKMPSPPGSGPGKSLLVYNPAAGERVGLDQITAICRLFSERGWRVLPVPTQGPGSALEIIRAFSQEVESVIVLGGDVKAAQARHRLEFLDRLASDRNARLPLRIRAALELQL